MKTVAKISSLCLLFVTLCYHIPTNEKHHLNKLQVWAQPDPPIFDKRQAKCLVDNAYHEARGEGRQGWMAVTYVVINRTKDKKFPNDACSVINQKRKKVCQFSWVCEGKKHIKDLHTYKKIESTINDVTYVVRYNKSFDITKGSLYYKKVNVKSNFFKNRLRPTITIGQHAFYSDKHTMDQT